MNGFTNAILSLLLGWIRLLINQLWRLINSEGGKSFFSFLADQWMTLLLVLCVGGFIVDRIVYVLRWRPYYLWRGRRRRTGKASAYSEPVAVPPAYEPDDEPPAYLEERPTAMYQAAYQRPMPAPSDAVATTRYAPASQGRTPPYTPPATPYAPPQELSPVFDDDPEDWAPNGAVQPPQSMAEVMANVKTDFGAVRPEPAAYIRDMQAGFARPLPPEQLYSAAVPGAMPETRPAPQVHPGLDGERIRENVGLSPAGSLPGAEVVPVAPVFHSFAPFIPSDGERQSPSRSRANPFAALAKKARGFVSVGDEDDPRTIHDLQSTVDMRSAFHEPVYPRPRPAKEDEDVSTY